MMMFETTVDSIVSQFHKAIEKLQKHEENMRGKAQVAQEEADKIKLRISTCLKEASRAKAVAGKIGEILS